MTGSRTPHRPEGPAPDPDASLLARVAAGDAASLAELYDRFATRVYSVARRLCGDGALAQDATEAVFVAVWLTAGTFDPTRDAPARWLLALAHHRSVDLLRRRRSDRGSVESGPVPDPLVDLPPLQFRTVALAYYAGHTHGEIASLLGLPPATVRTGHREAMAHLRSRESGERSDGGT